MALRFINYNVYSSLVLFDLWVPVRPKVSVVVEAGEKLWVTKSTMRSETVVLATAG